MARALKPSGTLVLRRIVVLALLGWPRLGSAQGTWSVISLPQKTGEVVSPAALAAGSAGNLYLWAAGYEQLQKRDAQGTWSVVATYGSAVGHVINPTGLAVDPADSLYVADQPDSYGRTAGRIQKRHAQGTWSVIATDGWEPGQFLDPYALAVDPAGNLYVAGGQNNGYYIVKQDAVGNWSTLATKGSGEGQVFHPSALAVDPAGNLYVADDGYQEDARIQKRDAQGNWSTLATEGWDPGQVFNPSALAVDAAGNLYIADWGDGDQHNTGRIQKRDAQGSWSVVATYGSAVGQVSLEPGCGLTVDGAGNLYVADTGNNRVQVYRPSGGP